MLKALVSTLNPLAVTQKMIAPAASAAWAVATPTQVTVSWSAVPGAASYLIKRATSPSGLAAGEQIPVVVSPFVDTLVPTTRFYYAITPVFSDGSLGAVSNIVGVICYPSRGAGVAGTFAYGLALTITSAAVTKASELAVYLGGTTRISQISRFNPVSGSFISYTPPFPVNNFSTNIGGYYLPVSKPTSGLPFYAVAGRVPAIPTPFAIIGKVGNALNYITLPFGLGLTTASALATAMGGGNKVASISAYDPITATFIPHVIGDAASDFAIYEGQPLVVEIKAGVPSFTWP